LSAANDATFANRAAIRVIRAIRGSDFECLSHEITTLAFAPHPIGITRTACRSRSRTYGTTPGFFESTPLMIDGVLYVTTPYNSIAAVDAETGKELWRGKIPYENTAVPMTYRTRSGRQFVVVATGARPDKRAGGFCAECQVTTSAG